MILPPSAYVWFYLRRRLTAAARRTEFIIMMKCVGVECFEDSMRFSYYLCWISAWFLPEIEFSRERSRWVTQTSVWRQHHSISTVHYYCKSFSKSCSPTRHSQLWLAQYGIPLELEVGAGGRGGSWSKTLIRMSRIVLCVHFNGHNKVPLPCRGASWGRRSQSWKFKCGWQYNLTISKTKTAKTLRWSALPYSTVLSQQLTHSLLISSR